MVVTLVSTAARGSGAGSGAITQLFDSTLAAPATNIDANGLPQTYNHLMIVLRLRSSEVAVFNSMLLTFNNDSGANYVNEEIHAQNTTAAANASVSQNGMLVIAPGASAAAGFFGAATLLVTSYADTTAPKSMVEYGGALISLSSGTSNRVETRVGLYNSNTAISRATITAASAANFATGSRMTIYGML
jgi:hypothetical protein